MNGATVKVKRREREISQMEEALGYGMLNLGFHIEERAKANVPVRTGNLRRSIHTVAFANGHRIGSSEGELPAELGALRGIGVVVGTNTGYGLYVELGTVRMRARPYLTPAAQDGLANAIHLISEGAKARFPSVPS